MSRSGAMVKMNGTNASTSKVQPANNIWQLMNYSIPRGKCVHKPSMLSPSCPCLRFMLNPLQAASSFACDGCGHHASFHNLKGPEDDEGFRIDESQNQAVVLNGNGRKRSATVAGVNAKGKGRLQIANGSASAGARGEDEMSVLDVSDGEDDSLFSAAPAGKRARS
ncbi:hypothetical protein EDC01DRAFT_268314 [Geopyxis carbonaria]|nr:hypothetical protein EDC01DRAFT_268314 [Geopyxis carbonaria]